MVYKREVLGSDSRTTPRWSAERTHALWTKLVHALLTNEPSPRISLASFVQERRCPWRGWQHSDGSVTLRQAYMDLWREIKSVDLVQRRIQPMSPVGDRSPITTAHRSFVYPYRHFRRPPETVATYCLYSEELSLIEAQNETKRAGARLDACIKAPSFDRPRSVRPSAGSSTAPHAASRFKLRDAASPRREQYAQSRLLSSQSCTEDHAKHHYHPTSFASSSLGGQSRRVDACRVGPRWQRSSVQSPGPSASSKAFPRQRRPAAPRP